MVLRHSWRNKPYRLCSKVDSEDVVPEIAWRVCPYPRCGIPTFTISEPDISALVKRGFYGPVTFAKGDTWKRMPASSVSAYMTESGFAVDANVQLPNNCYEAKVRSIGVDKPQYEVVDRVKPKDVGKMCNMVVVPSVAHGSFINHHPPKTITVYATNKRLPFLSSRQNNICATGLVD